MNNKYLVYRMSDGLCVNCIVWDGVNPCETEEGTVIEIAPAGSFAGIGWTRISENVWAEPVIEEPTA
jgi:hypothetical protein